MDFQSVKPFGRVSVLCESGTQIESAGSESSAESLQSRRQRPLLSDEHEEHGLEAHATTSWRLTRRNRAAVRVGVGASEFGLKLLQHLVA